MRVVVDTNVIVSAFLSPLGSASTFMNKVFGNAYEVIVTESIMQEYDNVLHRKKFRFKEEVVQYILKWFRENALFVEVDEDDYPTDEMIDPKDAVFYVAARSTGARLVTGNIKHYPIVEFRTMLWEMV